MRKKHMNNVLKNEILENVSGGIVNLEDILFGAVFEDLGSMDSTPETSPLSSPPPSPQGLNVPTSPPQFGTEIGKLFTYGGWFGVIKDRYGVDRIHFNPYLKNGDVVLDRGILYIFNVDFYGCKSLTKIQIVT